MTKYISQNTINELAIRTGSRIKNERNTAAVRTDRKTLLSQLQGRMDDLKQVIAQKRAAIQAAPAGSLRISKTRGAVRYYHRPFPKSSHVCYISEAEIRLAEQLAQKDYDRKVLDMAEKEIRIEASLVRHLENHDIDALYPSLSPERKRLVIPVAEERSEFIRLWEAVPYQRQEILDPSGRHFTLRGERVRSKSEVLIADALLRHQIPYRYEYPVYMNGAGIIHPDFQVLHAGTNEEVFWEHFGMMDDHDYAVNAVRRIELYEMNGYFPGKQLILTFETGSQPLNVKMIEMIIEQYLE